MKSYNWTLVELKHGNKLELSRIVCYNWTLVELKQSS